MSFARNPPERGQAARTAAFYRVCTDIAAKRVVVMERAKIDLQEHQIACASAIRAEVAHRTGGFGTPPRRPADSKVK